MSMKSGIVKIGNWWLLGKNTIGVTIYPFIFIKKSWADKVHESVLNETINHEKIHIRQQLELLVIPFYLWYFIEFFIRSLSTSTTTEAYMKISFENEAYKNHSDHDYLRKRKFWNFLKFM